MVSAWDDVARKPVMAMEVRMFLWEVFMIALNVSKKLLFDLHP
jgi:hypothetical protein